MPSSNFVEVAADAGQAASKIAEYREKCDQGQLDTIRLNGMRHAGASPAEQATEPEAEPVHPVQHADAEPECEAGKEEVVRPSRGVERHVD